MISALAGAVVILGRWAEFSILWKATLMLIAGLAAARLAIRARASVRHLLLAATFGTLLALPVVVLTLPGWTLEVPVSRAAVSATLQSAAPPPGELRVPDNRPDRGPVSEWSWPVMLRLGWMAGAILLLIPLAVDLWRLRRICRQGLPSPELLRFTQSLALESGMRREVDVVLHEDIPAPLTCGVWRPVIVLPCDANEWSEDELQRALVHELEHVRRRDWATQLAARTICACYWFHPLVWMAWRRLCLESERACDDSVVRGAERTEYAEQLVVLARRLSTTQAQPALGMANRSDLSKRVAALLDDSQRRGRAGFRAIAAALAVTVVAVLAIGPLRAVAQSSNPGQRRLVRSLDRALFEAAESGDDSGINDLLGAGANVNCALDGDGSPLIGAARKGRLSSVRLLLDRGADPNMPVTGDGNPLIAASRAGHIDAVALLLDRGASINQVVPDDENALIQASGAGHLEVVKLLVRRGADVNARVWLEPGRGGLAGEWRTPLNMARRGKHTPVVDYLLSAGARE